MTIKRRGFISMLGGAFAAPLMPSVSLGAATKVAYPASALHAAIYHAQSRVNFSVFALAQRLNLDLAQAEQLMADMSARGIVGPLQGSTQAGRWARSKVWRHPVTTLKSSAKTQPSQKGDQKSPTQAADETAPWADLRPLMAHLQDICRSQGRTLHTRCAALV